MADTVLILKIILGVIGGIMALPILYYIFIAIVVMNDVTKIQRKHLIGGNLSTCSSS